MDRAAADPAAVPVIGEEQHDLSSIIPCFFPFFPLILIDRLEVIARERRDSFGF